MGWRWFDVEIDTGLLEPSMKTPRLVMIIYGSSMIANKERCQESREVCGSTVM